MGERSVEARSIVAKRYGKASGGCESKIGCKEKMQKQRELEEIMQIVD